MHKDDISRSALIRHIAANGVILVLEDRLGK